MPLTQDTEVWQRRLAAFPLASYGAGETVFSEGTKTGRLLILKAGLVELQNAVSLAPPSTPQPPAPKEPEMER